MPTFLSPGVYLREIDLTLRGAAFGFVRPAFIGTANKGPMNTPTLVTSATDYIDKFGLPFAESYLGYAVLGYLEEGDQCYVTRVGIEQEDGQEDGLADVAIDTSGNKEAGWGRIPLFSGIDYGRILFRAITTANPASFHPASVSTPVYNDAESSDTFGNTGASLSVTGTYTGSIDDAFTVLITAAPDVSSASKISGASYQVIKGSDGTVVASGTLTEPILGQSALISIGDGLSIRVYVTSGVLDVNDTFTFTVVADNRKFQFSVEGTNGTEYTMPTASYSTAASLAAAINTLAASEPYTATVKTLDDGTIALEIRTETAGRWLQLVGTAAWATELGQSRYAYDIPRSFLLGTAEGPYTISAQRNKLVMKVVGETADVNLSFTIATGTEIDTDQVAANIDPNGVIGGTTYFDAFALTIPGGTSHLVMVTTTDHQTDQLVLVANYTNLKTLRFAEEMGILYPYKNGYRTFSDSRVVLPAASSDDESVPASCDDDPSGADCAADSSYYQNIVGFLVAPSPGTWVDDYTVDIETFTEGVGTVAGRYKITVRDASGLILDIIQDVSFDKSATRYIGNVVNPGSRIGGINGNRYINWEPRPAALDYDVTASSYTVRQPAIVIGHEFSGQQNGIPTDAALSSDLDAVVIGNPATSTGVFAFQNPETYDINLLATPGFNSGSVISQCLTMCSSRGDVMYLVDPPFGLRPQQVIDWHNGMLLSDQASTINSSYGALYWSWIKIFDQVSAEEIWIPPSGHVAAIFSRTSRVSESWSAPAGINRGKILTALNVEVSPSQGERDALYGFGNAVNPITKFPNDGIVVWGQRTLQRADTALDRVSVRMLMSYLKKSLTQVLRQFIFEPNDSILWSQVQNTVNPIMSDVLARRGVEAFKVVCDASNNPPDQVAQGILTVTVFIMPVTATEFIALNMVALKSSASFSSQEVLTAGGIVQ